ncbi:PH domain-containing protein [Serinicoccus hydrothermalis]|uniref:PH domain-containing protein n=1 Tax=Serinicoccus hydrothermalis TaxID=1758689 RepID=UPI00082B3390|nr:PH domain-containing protein [Serinicoccus hydrothermalis]
MSEVSDEVQVWRQLSRGWTRLLWGLLVVAVVFFVVAVATDVHWGTRVSTVCNMVVASCWLIVARSRTVVDGEGIVVRQLRQRRIPWSEVAATQAAGDRVLGPTRVRLRDGDVVGLPGVRGRDLDRLEQIRRGGR